MQSNLEFNERELLIRLDERVRGLSEQITVMQTTLIPPSEHKSLMLGQKENDARITDLENWRAKVIGYSIGAAATVSGAVSLITDAIQGLG